MIEIELEPPLGDGLLDALAVGRVAGRAGTPLALVDEAADLVRRAPRVLLAGAEAVHSGLAGGESLRSPRCAFSAVACDDDGDDGDDDSRARCTRVKSLRSRWSDRRSRDGDHDDDDDDDDDAGAAAAAGGAAAGGTAAAVVVVVVDGDGDDDGNGALRNVARS